MITAFVDQIFVSACGLCAHMVVFQNFSTESGGGIYDERIGLSK
jgi:hypothetical protein